MLGKHYRRRNITVERFITKNAGQINSTVDQDLAAAVIAAREFTPIEQLVLSRKHLQLIEQMDQRRKSC